MQIRFALLMKSVPKIDTTVLPAMGPDVGQVDTITGGAVHGKEMFTTIESEIVRSQLKHPVETTRHHVL